MNTTASRANAEEITEQIAQAAEDNGWMMNDSLREALCDEILQALSEEALDVLLTALARGVYVAR